MRIIVTGACGFIGSVFALRASELGHQVIGLDDESRGLNGDRVRAAGVEVRRHDCREGIPKDIDRIEAVAHFAAGTGSLDRPIEELRELNVKMTLTMVKDAAAHGAYAFVWPTTSLALAVPDSPYVQSKEEALVELQKIQNGGQSGMRIICCRFFNVAGAYKGLTERRKNEVHLLPMMVEHFKNKGIVTIQGTDYDTVDGTPSRDFINVVDVVDYLLDVTSKKTQPLQQDDSAIWIGTGRTLTVKQACGVFERFVGELDVAKADRRAFDTGVIKCPTSSVQRLTQWRPLVPAWVSVRDEAQALLKE